ncbi:CGNR zinc finger domain-containing protein [Bradyrhizobium sp. CB1650]|uniref:CGNR zinc finger domain-containing protein n=1 Tax=Bradyrhizobium sp. CB1650 TaxID=3039153 RepID=UPI002435A5BC|nr:ABATE domain-containing protein [Bradyrhizobium sp. CB1650]WGD49081.1 CGNR zinc finger domain-containing protein [Bradyrhizobium sp. CB1650]
MVSLDQQRGRALGSSISAKSPQRPAEGDLDEELAIRFVNTVAWRLRDPQEERLPDADALLAWLGRNHVGSPRDLKHVRSAWQANAARAKAAYRDAMMLREAIYEILIARINHLPPPHGGLSVFNRMLARSTPSMALKWEGGDVTWGVRPQGDGPDLLKPIITSAAALMTGPRARRVKQCQDDRGCGWLFIDESRAQNRRWCSMGDCGNRAKAHRHYQRTRPKERGR